MTKRNCSECPQLLIDEAVEFWIREVGKPHYIMSFNLRLMSFNLRLMRTLRVERSSEKFCYVLVSIFTNILALKNHFQINIVLVHTYVLTMSWRRFWD